MIFLEKKIKKINPVKSKKNMSLQIKIKTASQKNKILGSKLETEKKKLISEK